jgi:hypothetical protein
MKRVEHQTNGRRTVLSHDKASLVSQEVAVDMEHKLNIEKVRAALLEALLWIIALAPLVVFLLVLLRADS